ncbi:MAG TPA: hypothetical protein VMI31_11490 [Fimbriimonadaceae bacterium]|nr:hypothetical protein [Fimbriimonadaceae bacterium]
MFNQTFQIGDLGTILFLVFLEALLSADNALVLALLARHLDRDHQKKALIYGMGGAFVLRTAAILLAATIIGFWWLQLIGAGYLLFLPAKHFADARRPQRERKRRELGFWTTVAYLNVVDTAFALDSVIVAIAVVDTVRNPEKIWVVIAGAIIGIVLLRFAANGFIQLLDRFPRLEHVAYLLVAWAGVKLLFIAWHSFENRYDLIPGQIPEIPPLVFWGGMALIAGIGSYLASRRRSS